MTPIKYSICVAICWPPNSNGHVGETGAAENDLLVGGLKTVIGYKRPRAILPFRRPALLLVLPLIIHLETLAKAVRLKETAR